MKIDELGVSPILMESEPFQRTEPDEVQQEEVTSVEEALADDLDSQGDRSQPRLGAVLNLLQKAKDKRGKGIRNSKAHEAYLTAAGIKEYVEFTKGMSVNTRA